ncbi:hypothetical protein RhiirA5_411607 [Rhizophagus irregularis]|uniref:Uncharacterized protein n=2 Tax=Rhizophagus irregularis TaxID=588596 RepID=A0A2N0RXQ0_9GLOM|nr:hypothetical protein RirG_036820 [Rhizophagus irregularis DAOM 197198w]PKC12618.1 hypothetical protein RhiirA5_411607 [Rhizophagus irregularis]PKC68070.1 hypothetical protein RhiirA1_457682 [Rhizophagus irregularis]
MKMTMTIRKLMMREFRLRNLKLDNSRGLSLIEECFGVDIDESVLNHRSTEADSENLGGVIMKRQCKFIKYFQDGYKPMKEKLD